MLSVNANNGHLFVCEYLNLVFGQKANKQTHTPFENRHGRKNNVTLAQLVKCAGLVIQVSRVQAPSCSRLFESYSQGYLGFSVSHLFLIDCGWLICDIEFVFK